MTTDTCASRLKKSLLFFCMVLSVGRAIAQSPQKEQPYRIGASIGYSFTGFREETDLPLNKFTNTLTYLIDGNIEKGSFFHSLYCGFFRGKNDAVPAVPLYEIEIYPPLQSFMYYQKEYIFTRAYLEYALDYRLWGNRTFPGYLGGAFRADLYLVETLSDQHFSITGLGSLGLHITQKWIINADNMLVFSCNFPLIGYAVRPPYFGSYYEYSQFEKKIISMHNNLAVFAGLKYSHKINELISLSTGLGFELSRITFPRPRKDAAFRLNTGIAFTF